MLNIYKNLRGTLTEVESIEPRTWIDASNPTPEELLTLCKHFDLDAEVIADTLDADERARCETDDDYDMVIYRIPTSDRNEKTGYLQYSTATLGIILVKDCMITICRRDTSIISDVLKDNRKHAFPQSFATLILQIFWQASRAFLNDLKAINNATDSIQKKIGAAMSNKHLFGLMSQEKTLVYFTTSLRSNDFLLDRIKKALPLFRKGLSEDEEDLLEDVVVENRQALDTAKIYNDILTGMMDAYASVINNNVNQILKTFASLSLVLAVATAVFSFYGMNIQLPGGLSGGFSPAIAFISGGTLVVCLALVVLFRRMKML